ncbi:MAG: FKBP-type peptidyl-prolyl cis-trans isomerase SlyD [Planctomycetota bacterium]|jgi:FKBP-type peptidyl-prolyl cis-trans isomerase SlyD
MKISLNAVVSIDYELKDDAGEVIDSSKDDAPLAYLHGIGNLLPGLESELLGKSNGDNVKVRLTAEDGYGERSEEMVQVVKRAQFPADVTIERGMQFQTDGPQGAVPVTVVEVDGDEVKLDGNHPLAGVNLNFDVTVVEVREASAEELEHGHVHGPGGHHH